MGLQNSSEQKQQVPTQTNFTEQDIIIFLKSKNYKVLSLLGQKNQGTVVLAYSYQHKANVAIKIFSNQQEFEQEKSNLLKLKGERYIIQMITEISSVDTFSMGILLLVALLGDTLNPLQIYQLKFQLLENVIPNIKNHPNYGFIHEIISYMINFNPQKRLFPIQLIQKFIGLYKIDQNCLKNLVLPQEQNFDQVQQQVKVQQSNTKNQNKDYQDLKKDLNSVKSTNIQIPLFQQTKISDEWPKINPVDEKKNLSPYTSNQVSDLYKQFLEKKDANQWDQAYEIIQIICKKMPNYSEFWFYLGYSQDQLNLLSDAIKSYQRCLELNPNYYQAFGNLGVDYLKKGMLDDAIKSLQKYLEFDPNYYQAFYNLGVAYEKKGMLSEAIKSHQRCLQINPNYYQAYNNLGVDYANKGMLDEAIKSHQRCLELNPNYHQSYDNLGIVYYNKGMLDEAIKSHKRSIELNPKDYKAFNNLGVAYQRKGMLDEAIQSYKRCIQLNPNYYQTFDNLGKVYYKKGMMEEAIKSHQRSIELNPKECSFFNNLGLAYESKGMLENAIKSYQRCIELNPKYNSQRNLERVKKLWQKQQNTVLDKIEE
ncbi:hypothetical protein ABPG74_019742 [Tetrahymena malaccensis]